MIWYTYLIVYTGLSAKRVEWCSRTGGQAHFSPFRHRMGYHPTRREFLMPECRTCRPAPLPEEACCCDHHDHHDPHDNPACGCGCGEKGDCCAPRCCCWKHEDRLQSCCDLNGCCCLYPANCRNPFWPAFTHPRWLCCTDLYDGKSESCYSCCSCEEAER